MEFHVHPNNEAILEVEPFSRDVWEIADGLCVTVQVVASSTLEAYRRAVNLTFAALEAGGFAPEPVMKQTVIGVA